MFDLPDLHQVFADNISVVLKAIAYIFEQCWYGEILVLLGWCIWSRNQNVLPDCSGCAMRLWVQMAVAGELFLTIFSMCLHLFEDDRVNRELFMNQMLSFFFFSTSHHNVHCPPTYKQMWTSTFEPESLFLCFLLDFCTLSCCRIGECWFAFNERFSCPKSINCLTFRCLHKTH